MHIHTCIDGSGGILQDIVDQSKTGFQLFLSRNLDLFVRSESAAARGVISATNDRNGYCDDDSNRAEDDGRQKFCDYW